MAGLRVEGSSFFVAGRFERLPKSRVERELGARGAKLHRRFNRNTDFAVVTHEAAGRIASPAFAVLRALAPERCLSEETFLRALGLAPALQGKDIDESRLLGLTGLGRDDVRLLSLFDILTPAGGQFGFNDLKVAQHIAHLQRRRVSLDMVLVAATELRRRRRGSPHDVTRLDLAPSGELMMRIGDVLAELDGQMRFAWVEPPPDPDVLFEAAEEAESSGDLLRAERLYYACLSASPRDPVIRFNIGNVLRDLGRSAEAKAHYLAAIDAEPDFAEAHFNLGHLAMGAGNSKEAIAHLERAVLAEPRYPDPLYNLAVLYIRGERVKDAVPVLERYLRLDAASKWAHEARKLLLACRTVLSPRRRGSDFPAPHRNVEAGKDSLLTPLRP
ncbi:MAG TPA: tetratricopeptide repeat protein [Stellaceae bacterium]|nr:tetratricopeptide repeat protein [Stellaceae bacterium]